MERNDMERNDMERLSTCRVHHAGVTVSDLGASIDFYATVLGCRLLHRIEPEDLSGARRLVGVQDAVIAGRMLQLGSGERIELLSYRSTYQRRLDVRPCDTPILHLAFTVQDVRAAMRSVTALGGRLFGQPVDLGGGASVYCGDPDGNTLEFIEEAAVGSDGARAV
jgi:catechol 2,3-dioxygenase-like lactoylglutathione lyase family enzyme